MVRHRALLIDFAGTREATSFHSWPDDILERCDLALGRDDGALPASALEYAAMLADRIEPARPRHIMAFCLAAGIAQLVARILTDRGGEPVLLTAFDPTVCEPADLQVAYEAVAGQIVGADAVPILRLDLNTVAATPQKAVEAITEDLQRRACIALGRSFRLDDALVNGLVDRYMRWLRYLALAIDCDWPRWDGQATRIMSAEYDAALPWPGVDAVVSHRVDVPQVGLLASPDVHSLVRRRLLT
ncbi:hypothetical protein [Krasilnikovia sp. MM14-A1259]|uniref:hypothetical protein n=1 Tax=Krasilnikovia sp. MM14-A1259 TaxID=3373539 RepID=UPI00380DD734